MRSRTRKTLNNFSSKFSGPEEMTDAMERETADVFKKDPDLADIIYHFADSVVEFNDEITKEPPTAGGPDVISLIIGKEDAQRMMKATLMSSVLVTMIKNLQDAGIIDIIPKHKRIAKEIIKNIENKK